MMAPFVWLPAHLPMAPRPLAGELLSSWLGRLAAANALDFGEVLELVHARLARPRAGECHAGELDYACSRPRLQALSTLSRLPAARIAALSLKRRFGPLGLFWLSHDTAPVYDAHYRLVLRPQVRPGYCVECLREQTQQGQPAHLRAEWALAFLTHCPRHRAVGLRYGCRDCREVASLGWGLGRGQPPTMGCGRCAVGPEGVAFLERPPPLSGRQEGVLRLEAALLAALGVEGRGQRAPDPRWAGAVGPAAFVRLVGELIEMLGWPDAGGGFSLLEHLQRGSCRAPEPVWRPLPAGCEPFGGLGRQERFELLAGVVELLGSGLGEGRPPGKPAPFGCLYGPLSAERRGAFLERLQRWPERVRRRALAAVACFQSAPRTRGSHGCTQKKGVSPSLAERFNCKKAGLLNELAAKSPPERVAERFNCK